MLSCTFESKHGAEIEYAMMDKADVLCESVFDGDGHEGELVCVIESVYLDKEKQGFGLGGKSLNEFVEKQKEKGTNRFYLFASYEESEFNAPDLDSGLKRLVNFYRKHGFEDVFGFSSNCDQVDMFLAV